MNTIEQIATSEEAIQNQIHSASVQWSKEFHDAVISVLAPRGFKTNFQHRKIAVLEFLTEDRIKKVANTSHRLLKEYKTTLLKNLAEEYGEMAVQRQELFNRIDREKSYAWWRRSNKLIRAYTEEVESINIKINTFNKLVRIVHTIKPIETISESAVNNQGV